jgi:ATP diphosphatase
MSQNYSIEDLLNIMQRLRDPDNGCPWDLKQTYASLVPMTLEEAYEIADAVDRHDLAELQGELGDVLLHIVFYAQIAKEQGEFHFADVVQTICEKMIRRHPHIFGDENAADELDVKQRWEAIKKQERAAKNKAHADDFFEGITAALPALKHAVKLKKRAATIGFDWQHWEPAADKVNEELEEVRDSLRNNESKERVEEELGDLLFTVANLAEQLKIDPENALRKANKKFSNRVNRMLDHLNAEGKHIEDCSLEEMDAAWDIIKKH